MARFIITAPSNMSDGMLYQSEGREGPQGNIKLLVDNDNIKFEDWVIEMKKMQVFILFIITNDRV